MERKLEEDIKERYTFYKECLELSLANEDNIRDRETYLEIKQNYQYYKKQLGNYPAQNENQNGKNNKNV